MFTLGVIWRSKNQLMPRVLFGLALKLTNKHEVSLTLHDDACTWLECRMIVILSTGIYFGFAFLGYGMNIAFCNSLEVDKAYDQEQG